MKIKKEKEISLQFIRFVGILFFSALKLETCNSLFNKIKQEVVNDFPRRSSKKKEKSRAFRAFNLIYKLGFVNSRRVLAITPFQPRYVLLWTSKENEVRGSTIAFRASPTDPSTSGSPPGLAKNSAESRMRDAPLLVVVSFRTRNAVLLINRLSVGPWRPRWFPFLWKKPKRECTLNKKLDVGKHLWKYVSKILPVLDNFALPFRQN